MNVIRFNTSPIKSLPASPDNGETRTLSAPEKASNPPNLPTAAPLGRVALDGRQFPRFCDENGDPDPVVIIGWINDKL